MSEEHDSSGAAERILDAAEEVLRRYGPTKTTVVDVARHLGMSHGNVYRHFPSKAALRDAVAERWLSAVSRPLGEIAEGDGPAAERLAAWLRALIAIKQRKVRDDPEMFATYHALAEGAREVVDAHVTHLRDQVARILTDGVAQGVFILQGAPQEVAKTVLEMTMRFHHPHFVRDAEHPPTTQETDRTLAMVIAALKAGAA